MKLKRVVVTFTLLALANISRPLSAASHALLGWNDLGMHCMDADFSVFSLLPPYNTIHAQLIVQGRLVTAAGNVRVTYEALADAAGSANRTSAAKTDFWRHAKALYLPLAAPDLAPDIGLAGFAMPGAANTPQVLRFDAAEGWFSAEGIPITPLDDAGHRNPYPLMRLVARDTTTGNVLASTDIVLPVSDEMDCRACHASGTVAMPGAGWAWDCDPQHDYRRNILQVHDELNLGSPHYIKALKEVGYDTRGLQATARLSGPILCARCHASNALPGSGQPGIPPLTRAIHAWHAEITDPDTGKPLKDDATRAACYRCHPGSETRCLRGAMGSAVAADGTRAMDCQSCHGSMDKVGAAGRRGWLDEPACQNCHTGTAVNNSGAIRFTSAFDDTGSLRAAADPTFATDADVPVAGASLFRFSRGHGGLYCSACHGSPHAEFPSTEANDNVYSQKLQGHAGMIAECSACHTTMPTAASGGPHGLHPIGSSWISGHKNPGKTSSNCRPCHGADLRGTVLSRTLANRTFSAFGTKNWWRGFQVGCYNCHRGPTSDDANANHPAMVSNASLNTRAGQPVTLQLTASDADNNPLTFRIVAQPRHGTVALDGRAATYLPEPDFVGNDSFTFAAWDGSTDSNLGTVNLTVTAGDCALTLRTTAPAEWEIGAAAPFRAATRRTGCDSPVTYEWTWSDGAPAGPGAEVCRSFAAAGTYHWQLTARAGAKTETATGSVVVKTAPGTDVTLTATRSGADLRIAWPATATGYELETTPSLRAPTWQPAGLMPVLVEDRFVVAVPATASEQYFRLRKGP